MVSDGQNLFGFAFTETKYQLNKTKNYND